jgi:hypothetical protein
MAKIIVGLFMILGGIVLISLDIYDNRKKTMNMDTEDNSLVKKHINSQRLLNITVGSCFIVLGITLILDIVNGGTSGILCLLILFIDRIVGIIIDKKYQKE